MENYVLVMIMCITLKWTKSRSHSSRTGELPCFAKWNPITSQIVVPLYYAGLKDAKAINEKRKKSIRGKSISEATSNSDG